MCIRDSIKCPAEETLELVRQFKPERKICSLVSSGGQNPLTVELPKQIVFLLGNELRGLSQSLEALSDERLTIKHSGRVESLNAAQAASTVMSYWYSSFGGS